MPQFEVGSISTGTLNPEDLLPTFARELERHAPDHALVTAAYAIQVYDDGGASELINEIQAELQNYCPPFVTFGTLEGDGADFGFWPDMDSLEEALIDPEWTLIDGELYRIPRDEAVLVHVNDHGNVTVMDLERNVLWAVV